MLGLFRLFGRSREVQRLDHAMRAAGLHPLLAPDSVKLATLRMLRDARGETSPGEEACASAAALLAYCMLGHDEYAQENGEAAVRDVEVRMRHAIDAGDSLDARLALLTLYAGVAHPEVVERYGLEAD